MSTDSLARVITEQPAEQVHPADAAMFLATVTELAAVRAARILAAEQSGPAPITVVIPAAEPAAPIRRPRRLFTRIELIAYCGISSAVTVAIGAIAADATGSIVPLGAAGVGGLLTSFGAAIAGCRDDDRRIGGEQR